MSRLPFLAEISVEASVSATSAQRERQWPCEAADQCDGHATTINPPHPDHRRTLERKTHNQLRVAALSFATVMGPLVSHRLGTTCLGSASMVVGFFGAVN